MAIESFEMLNSGLLIIGSLLVMLMAVGFTFLEAGLVSRKSVASVLTKNVTAFAVCAATFFALGFSVLSNGMGAFDLQALNVWSRPSYGTKSAEWLYQMLFAAACTSIVSGAVAERIRIGSFLVFAMVNAGLIYPIVGHWVWGGGWLQQMGFVDFAGATVVHGTGGWAALMACLFLGPRLNRFEAPDNAASLSPSSLPLTTLGVFLLWIGWFGFNGGSVLPIADISGIETIADVIVFTNAGAVGGMLFGVGFSQLVLRRWDLGLILNSALAGLVAVTAAPYGDPAALAFLWGAVGAGLMLATTKLLEALRVDDVVGSAAVHLVPGIFSTIVVAGYQNGGTYGVQSMGVLAAALWVVGCNLLLWTILRYSVGIRLSPLEEIKGSDLSEVGLEAYDLIDADMQHFSYFATHDLKQPLRSIHSFAQLLEANPSEPDSRRFVANIKEASAKMGSIIDDLISYSRLNHVSAEPHRIDIERLARDTFDRCRTLDYPRQDHNFTTKDLPTVYCNKILISHVFNNIIENAIKYRAKERSLLVEVEAEDRPKVWVFRISDNGSGIEQHHRNLIFQMFSRCHADADVSGNGIGLAIVRKAVYRLGGVIWVQSRPGVGTSFFFTLPKDPLSSAARDGA